MHPPNDGCPGPPWGTISRLIQSFSAFNNLDHQKIPALPKAEFCLLLFMSVNSRQESAPRAPEKTSTTSFPDRSLPFLVTVVPVPMLQMLDGPFSSLASFMAGAGRFYDNIGGHDWVAGRGLSSNTVGSSSHRLCAQ